MMPKGLTKLASIVPSLYLTSIEKVSVGKNAPKGIVYACVLVGG